MITLRSVDLKDMDGEAEFAGRFVQAVGNAPIVVVKKVDHHWWHVSPGNRVCMLKGKIFDILECTS